jgi:DNA-binding NarL/FixJ family response regulator
MIRVVIADDHPIFRQGLERLIGEQPDMRVVREVADGRQALQAADECDVDVLILDLSLPRVNGLEVLRRLRTAHPGVRVLVLSMYPADHYEARALEQGAAAYLSKDEPPTELLRAVRAVAAGDPWRTAIAGRTAPQTKPPHMTLTAREHQVFTLLFQGETVTSIAAELDLSASTVSNHVSRIRDKLCVRSIAGVVRYAVEAGLTGSPPAAAPEAGEEGE